MGWRRRRIRLRRAARRPRRAGRASQRASAVGPRGRPRAPPSLRPAPAGPRHQEDAPQEPGSRASGSPRVPAAPPTCCHGRQRPRGHVAATGLLPAPRPAAPPRDAEGPSHLGTVSAPLPGDSGRPPRSSSAALFPLDSRSLPSRLPRFPWPRGRQPKVGSARASFPMEAHRAARRSGRLAPLPCAPFPSCPWSGSAELAGGAIKSGRLRASRAPGSWVILRGPLPVFLPLIVEKQHPPVPYPHYSPPWTWGLGYFQMRLKGFFCCAKQCACLAVEKGVGCWVGYICEL